MREAAVVIDVQVREDDAFASLEAYLRGVRDRRHGLRPFLDASTVQSCFGRSRSSGFTPIVHVSGTDCGVKQTLSSQAW